MTEKSRFSRVWLIFAGLVCIGSSAAILSCSSISAWNRSVRDAKEQTLQHNLGTIREAIKQYAERNQELPQTLDDLTTDHSFKLPDPVTGKVDWQVVIGKDPALPKRKSGVIDVHSASDEISSKGTKYSSW